MYTERINKRDQAMIEKAERWAQGIVDKVGYEPRVVTANKHSRRTHSKKFVTYVNTNIKFRNNKTMENILVVKSETTVECFTIYRNEKGDAVRDINLIYDLDNEEIPVDYDLIIKTVQDFMSLDTPVHP